MKDSFLLLSDEGKEGVLLFHQELVGESMSARVGIGRSGPMDGERSRLSLLLRYSLSWHKCLYHRFSILRRRILRGGDLASFLKQDHQTLCNNWAYLGLNG